MSDLTGRCYCGKISISADGLQTVALCHCADCRRWTSSALPVFAAFADADVRLSPVPEERSFAKGVDRRACPECGTALTARFDYLPGQTYVPVGVFDQADALIPQVQCHAGSRLDWIPTLDHIPSEHGSARDTLQGKRP